MAWLNSPFSKIVIFYPKIRVVMQFTNKVGDVPRGFIQLLHWFADFAGPQSILQSLLSVIKKHHILGFGFSCAAGGAAKNASAFDASNKDTFVLGILMANGVVFFIETESKAKCISHRQILIRWKLFATEKLTSTFGENSLMDREIRYWLSISQEPASDND